MGIAAHLNEYICSTMANKRFTNDVRIKNNKARYEFELMDDFIAGIQLAGTEIKSIRESKANINEAFVSLLGQEVFVRNMFVAEYTEGTYSNHIPKRDRKLLLNKNEIKKIRKHMLIKGYTAIPTLLFVNENGLAKLKFSLAKGKKLHDKRESLKQKDLKRQIEREA
jgi:SsrA-binding protein